MTVLGPAVRPWLVHKQQAWPVSPRRTYQAAARKLLTTGRLATVRFTVARLAVVRLAVVRLAVGLVVRLAGLAVARLVVRLAVVRLAVRLAVRLVAVAVQLFLAPVVVRVVRAVVRFAVRLAVGRAVRLVVRAERRVVVFVGMSCKSFVHAAATMVERPTCPGTPRRDVLAAPFTGTEQHARQARIAATPYGHALPSTRDTGRISRMREKCQKYLFPTFGGSKSRGPSRASCHRNSLRAPI